MSNGSSNGGNTNGNGINLALETYHLAQSIDQKLAIREARAGQREDFINVMTKAYIQDKRFLKGIIVFLAALLCVFAGIQAASLLGFI